MHYANQKKPLCFFYDCFITDKKKIPRILKASTIVEAETQNISQRYQLKSIIYVNFLVTGFTTSWGICEHMSTIGTAHNMTTVLFQGVLSKHDYNLVPRCTKYGLIMDVELEPKKHFIKLSK